MTSHAIEAELVFFQAPKDGASPYNYVEEPPAGEPWRNYSGDTRKVLIHDIRGSEDQYSLDRDAFQVLKNIPSSATYETFDSDEAVREIYYPEVERLLLDSVPGAHSIILFDHTIRRANPNAPRQPVNQVHADQTERSTQSRVRKHVSDPELAEKYLKGRYRIINVWRPINGVVESSPLAFASAASTEDDDFVTIQHRYPTFNGEIMGVKYNPKTEWKYCSGLDNDERLLLKCFDSQVGVAKRVAHTAFVDPNTPADAKPRESIEVRALVFG
ncbi:putative methyltransferase [Penicillium brasilianum]|uniref:Putative methyltransferase n=1 Tax=Penicillium brasilianum TaxID=104259 RepID=A0A1S9RSU2_PENBI|nr:putative methyltransferase [Penicillium brasilianum]